MSLNLGKAKSKNVATSGGSSSMTSSADASSAQNALSKQEIFGGQVPFLQELWVLGQELARNPQLQNTMASGEAFASSAPGAIYDPLVKSFQGTFGPNSPYGTAISELLPSLTSGLSSIVSSPQPTFAAGGDNPLLDTNVALTLEQVSENLRRNVLPAIRSDAQSMGQFGGARQGVAEGLAISDANKQALQTASKMYGDQYVSDRAANLLSQRQGDATRLAAVQGIMDLISGGTAAASQGVQVGEQLANLGLLPTDIRANMANLQWNPLVNYANILGAPVVLGSASSQGTAGARETASASGSQYGNASGNANQWRFGGGLW